jgi:hypothetical protein
MSSSSIPSPSKSISYIKRPSAVAVAARGAALSAPSITAAASASPTTSVTICQPGASGGGNAITSTMKISAPAPILPGIVRSHPCPPNSHRIATLAAMATASSATRPSGGSASGAPFCTICSTRPTHNTPADAPPSA